jgi:hypothetical protein
MKIRLRANGTEARDGPSPSQGEELSLRRSVSGLAITASQPRVGATSPRRITRAGDLHLAEFKVYLVLINPTSRSWTECLETKANPHKTPGLAPSQTEGHGSNEWSDDPGLCGPDASGTSRSGILDRG